MLKALEENDIPIDYIVGTSMGGIIGGCYSVGLSPDQIEKIYEATFSVTIELPLSHSCTFSSLLNNGNNLTKAYN